jgi:glycosyltransferase involved in cell wall biosynthesis
MARGPARPGRTRYSGRVKVSVVVPAFNEERILEDSLASIRESAEAFVSRGWEVELIVCDNNSTDRTAEIARNAGAAVVFEPVNQISRARNTGASRATGDWLVFVDADSHPTRELFTDVADAMASGRVLAGGSTIASSAGARLPVRLVTSTWNWISRATRWAAGSFIFCDAAGFREAGGFSHELFASEEIDLFRRLKRIARRRRQAILILTRHPLRTSDRKIHLYSGREMLGFYLRTILKGGRTLRNPQDAFIWYDGRR